MGKKYVIEPEEQNIQKGNFEWFQLPIVVAGEKVVVKTLLRLIPYTEPDMEQVREEAYEDGYKTAKVQCNIQAEKDLREVGERHYQKGLSDAWEAARKICTNWVLPDSVLSKIFGIDKTIDDIMKENTASEAIEKIQAYEQEKEEIKVGDEVVGTYTGEEETEPFVIIRKIPEINPTYYFGIYSKSGEFCQGGLKLKKTGRHFPEIAEVLQKMKETT